MAKSKSQSPEFLEKRRRAIAELAKRRGQRRAVTSITASASPVASAVAGKVAKIVPRVAFAVRPQAQN